MINWKRITGSRCAIDSFYDWLSEDLTDSKLIKTLRGLGFQEDADKITKYLMRYKHNLLANNVKRAFRRNGC